MEYCYLNPFKMVMLSGVFGFIITFIYGYLIDYNLEDIKDICENEKKLFNINNIINCLFFLSAFRNIYSYNYSYQYIFIMSRTLLES